MDAKQGSQGVLAGSAGLPLGTPWIWRLVSAGTATYLSYWTLYFALQHGCNRR